MLAHNTYRDLHEEEALVHVHEGGTWQGFWHRVGYFFSLLFIIKHLRKSLFVMLLGVIYVGNRHYVSALVRRAEHEQVAVQNVRTEYMEWEMKYIRVMKRSHLARRAVTLGLQESKVPPKIVRVAN